MPSPANPAALFEILRTELPKIFAPDMSAPVVVSVDNLVTLEINARFELKALTIHGTRIEPEEKARLEHALIEAFNQAHREAAERATLRIKESIV